MLVNAWMTTEGKWPNLEYRNVLILVMNNQHNKMEDFFMKQSANFKKLF